MIRPVRRARRVIANLSDCDDCGRPIVFLPTIWGTERPRRAYNAEMVTTGDVHPQARYAFSRRRGGVVQVDPTAVGADLPEKVFTRHLCGRVKLPTPGGDVAGALGKLLADGPPPGRAPPRTVNLGFRRGFGRPPAPPPPGAP